MAGFSPASQAIPVYETADTHVSVEGLAAYGMFNSRQGYNGLQGGRHWREAFIKYGIKADTTLGEQGSAYSGFAMVSSGTWGDGDAGNFTDGSERTTKIEDAYLGWRSGDSLGWLGHDGLDISVGRQGFKLGQGFLIVDDGLNLGKNGGARGYNRGGAYYLGARHAFDRTAVVRIGGNEGWHGTGAWLKSDNHAQANTEMGVAALEYTRPAGTLGFNWVHGISVDEPWATEALKRREGMNTYSVRGDGSAGIPDANFAFEYAVQNSHGDQETAWYLQAGYQFSQVLWAPSLTARYTRYSQNWDMLFTGFSSGYGTWFQGEVAANYAGPFNSNTGVTHFALKANPVENVTLGALFFDFRTQGNRQSVNLDARELDLYVEWAVSPHLIVTPLLGLYRPDHSAAEGGSQSAGSGTNVYSQVTVAVPF
ncbi:hypothetical protein LN139_08210 [Pseudomonas sp. KNUC1026]|nr:hypothetical protein [Pseudomonas sp. KNUC1026]UFH51671.1 hypothetical protein LN139_08210 [Pseudomonas sp. KNUC1026]